MRTRVKICGITRPEDGLAAARLGADAIGLVFYAASPRVVDMAQALEITASLPAFVTKVGLFVNASEQAVESILQTVSLDLLQFHGDESPADCERYGHPYIKALRMKPGLDIEHLARGYDKASGILLDAYQAGVPGGTGQTFDWKSVPTGLDKALILAGGLTPANVAEAIRTVKPYAVDVSGGVEATKGIKDPDKIRSFMDAINQIKV